MEEITFLIEESADGGFIAKAISVSIVTEANTLEELRLMVTDALLCHFDILPKKIHYRYI